MKKIASLILSLVLVLGLAAPALADNTLGSETTNAAGDVVRTGTSTVSYEGVTPHWTVTVPASITAGATNTTDNVTVSGEFDVTQTVTVTADETVTLTDAESGATVSAAVTFGTNHTFVVRGNSTESVSSSQAISVAKPNVLFGTWSGTLNYTATSHQAVVKSISVAWAEGAGAVCEGDAVDKSEIVVTATYDDNSQVTLPANKFTVSPETWGGNTESITITLVGNTSITATLAPTSITPLVKIVKIASVEVWNTFVAAYNTGAGTYADNVAVVFEDDLRVLNVSMLPLGTTTRPFKGSIRGEIRQIIGPNQNLFGCLGDGALVQSVTIDIAYIDSGSLFGDVMTGASVEIENVHVKDSTCESLFGNVAGNVSFVNCSITNSTFTSVASSGAKNVDLGDTTLDGNSGLGDS